MHTEPNLPVETRHNSRKIAGGPDLAQGRLTDKG